ncbi:hypothetical protein [Enterococcus rotai]
MLGLIENKQIKGRVCFRYYPLKRMGQVD